MDELCPFGMNPINYFEEQRALGDDLTIAENAHFSSFT
jgi:hypothetical protein